MLLICDFCDSQKSGIFKIEAAFYITEDEILFPSDTSRYQNICLDCMGVTVWEDLEDD